jgi:enoyl-CoA hydratase/carnithine racemase
MDSPLSVQQTGRRLTLTLDDARRQNALSVEMIESIDHALEGAPHDLAALVIQGANGVFSAGADLKSLAEAQAKPLASGETDALQTLNAAGGRFFARFAALPFMTIAVVDGAAVGGGMGLAAASDVVIATPRARFALTETSLGIPPAQIAPYLAHRLGEHVARRRAMTGARTRGLLLRQRRGARREARSAASIRRALRVVRQRGDEAALQPYSEHDARGLYRRSGKELRRGPARPRGAGRDRGFPR